MESTYTLYMHTSPSGKVYIGVTKRNPEYRWNNGSGYKGNEYFSRAICKYGWDSFQHDIIATNLSYEEAANMEIDLIAIHDAANREFGYNIEHGGKMCGTVSEETKRKMSISCTGRKRSPEGRANMSISHMGNQNRTGKKSSPENRLKMSIARTGKSHKKHSEHAKILMSENCTRKRAVEQIDLNGNVVAMFCSLVDAANSVNTSPQHIGKVCRGITLTCRGYKWRYAS